MAGTTYVFSDVEEKIKRLEAQGKPPRIILIGRVSADTAHEIIKRYKDDPEVILITARMGSYPDGSPSAEVFLNSLPRGSSHPVVNYVERNQTESDAEKKQRIDNEERIKAAILTAMEGNHVTIIHAVSGSNTSSRALALLGLVATLRWNYNARTLHLVIPADSMQRNDREFTTTDGRKQYNAIMNDHRLKAVVSWNGWKPGEVSVRRQVTQP